MISVFISLHMALTICPSDIVAHMSEAMAQTVPTVAIAAKRKSTRVRTSLALSRRPRQTPRMDTFRLAWARALAACRPCL
jgi:hypothetical protein